MSNYDYKKGKERIENILDYEMEIEEKDKIPNDSNFTFDNGYISWVTSIFIDIRGSTEIFADEDKEETSKLIRSFTSETIEILRDDDNLREIGIRGDCVYAIYTTPLKKDTYECANKTFYVNTFINMLNKLLADRYITPLKVGIGMATAKELVVKAGRKGVDINNKVWIGQAVTTASNLSGKGDMDGNHRLMYSSCAYKNFIEELENKNKNASSWFSKLSIYETGYDSNMIIYQANVIKTEFNDWIKQGMTA